MRVHLAATECGQLFSHHRVVPIEQLAPSQVAQLGGALGRAHYIGEHHGGEHPVRLRAVAHAGNELLDLIEKKIEHILIEGLEQMVLAGEFDVLRAKDLLSHVVSAATGIVESSLRWRIRVGTRIDGSRWRASFS